MSGEMELMLTTRGKPCLLMDGYRHRLFRKSTRTISWLCLNSEREKCRGMVKTTHHNVVVSRTEHSCTRNLMEIEVKKTLQRCRERVREETSVPVYKIFQEEFSKRTDLMDAPAYNSAKTALCAERRRILGTTANGKNGAEVGNLTSSVSGPLAFDLPSTSKGNSLARLSFGCAVNNCINHSSSTTPDIAATYHRFPSNDTFRRQWTQFCGIGCDHVVTSERICSLHFEQSCFVGNSQLLLKTDAVPTLCPPFGHVKEEKCEEILPDRQESTASESDADVETLKPKQIDGSAVDFQTTSMVQNSHSFSQSAETNPVFSRELYTGLHAGDSRSEIPTTRKRNLPSSDTEGADEHDALQALKYCEVKMECEDDNDQEVAVPNVPVTLPGTVLGEESFSNCGDQDIQLFFKNVVETVLKFPPQLRAEAKAGVSSLISKLESMNIS